MYTVLVNQNVILAPQHGGGINQSKVYLLVYQSLSRDLEN